MKNKEIKGKPYVNAGALKGEMNQMYVCWIDIMGTRNTMIESFGRAVNFILRFHTCCITAAKENDVKLYPLMDGVFITSHSLTPLTKAINAIFEDAFGCIVNETNAHRFVIRGAIAYGNLAEGCNIKDAVCKEISNADEAYRNSLLIGMPMIQAYTSEKNAPPFGVYIHESARQIEELQGKYYKWFRATGEGLSKMKEPLLQYFQWCRDFSNYLELSEHKIATYEKMAEEYFTDMNKK